MLGPLAKNLFINTSKYRYKYHTLQLQTPSETVFGVFFWCLNTFSEGIWSTRDDENWWFNGIWTYLINQKIKIYW